MLSALAAMPPMAIASSVRLPSQAGQRVDEGVGQRGALRRDEGGGRRPHRLQQHAGHEDPERRPQRHLPPRGVPRQVAGVVRGVRGPARRVAERRPHRQQERAVEGVRAVGGRGVRLGQDDHRGHQEDHRQHGEGVALRRVDEVVAEVGDGDLQDHHDEQAQQQRPVQQGVEGVGGADAVDREPSDARGEGVEPGRQRVAVEAEGGASGHHLRHAEPRTAQPQEGVRDRSQTGAEHHGRHGRPEAEAEDADRQHADEDGGELHVGTGPGPQQLQRAAVPSVRRHRLRTGRLDGEDVVAVGDDLVGGRLGEGDGTG